MANTESPRSSMYLDPFTTLPEGYRERSVWKSLVKVIRDLGDKRRESIPPSSLSLTERNLIQYFNPEYSDEVPLSNSEEYKRSFHARQESVLRWVTALP
jgi:hypothetical protein